MLGIPCGHALAVSLERGDDPQTYAKGFYQLDAYLGTYSNPIFPPNVDATIAIEQFVGRESDPTAVLLPPNMRHPPGRPKKQRIRGVSEGGGRAKRPFHCGRCGDTGH